MKEVVIILFGLVMTISSCNKDEISNPCEFISCFNGGNCIEGICECPEGWTGSTCGTRVQPETVTVGQIVLSSYPTAHGNSDPWDIGDIHPDIYLRLLERGCDGAGQVLLVTNVINNASGWGDFPPYDANLTLKVSGQRYTIEVWDDDVTNEDDEMGGVCNILISSKLSSGSLPQVLTFSSANSTVRFEDLEFHYN